MTLKQWVEHFTKNGTGCPHCGCRDTQIVRSLAIQLGRFDTDTRATLLAVCTNPNCGFVRTFAPKLEEASTVLFEVFMNGMRVGNLQLVLGRDTGPVIKALRDNDYVNVDDVLTFSGWPSDSSFSVEVS